MTILNYTPHTINEATTGNSYPSNGVARLSATTEVVDNINGINIYHTTFGEVEGLPESEEGVVIIVSGMILDAVSDRDDLIAPGILVRDENGNPVGCKGFRA
jgi:hypothetical protein